MRNRIALTLTLVLATFIQAEENRTIQVDVSYTGAGRSTPPTRSMSLFGTLPT